MDLRRDRDVQRRAVSLSKLQKYRTVKRSWRGPADLATEFGDIRSDNDLCDAHMLASLKDGVVDFLITEDAGLHTRARRHGLADKAIYVREALDQLTGAYAAVDYSLRSIARRYCYELDPSDPIFRSLASDYNGFGLWWDACVSSHRECWVVSDATKIAALCVFKEERPEDAPEGVAGARVLKLCTFKVAEDYRGGRLGEQMLRQALCYAYDARFNTVYLTVFPKQQGLRELIRHYGFRKVSIQQNGELVYAKGWTRGFKIDARNLKRVRRAYPAFPVDFSDGLIVPVRPGYHDRLFPEARSRLPNMPGELFAGAWSQGNAARSSPSNSISKAYLSHARLNVVEPGTLVGFYRSSDAEFGIPSNVVAIGIAESYETISDYESAIRSIAKRSVYTDAEIENLLNRPGLKILKFIFYGYLNSPLSLPKLRELQVLTGPPQSFVTVRASGLANLNAHVQANLVSA